MMNTFQSPFQQQYQTQMYQRPQTNGIVWVQGIEGAKAYQLLPNSNAILMDSENDGRFYIKVSDNVGMCNLRVFRYEEETQKTTPQIDLSNYVTRQELETAIANMRGTKNEQSVSTNAKPSNTKQSN